MLLLYPIKFCQITYAGTESHTPSNEVRCHFPWIPIKHYHGEMDCGSVTPNGDDRNFAYAWLCELLCVHSTFHTTLLPQSVYSSQRKWASVTYVQRVFQAWGVWGSYNDSSNVPTQISALVFNKFCRVVIQSWQSSWWIVESLSLLGPPHDWRTRELRPHECSKSYSWDTIDLFQNRTGSVPVIFLLFVFIDLDFWGYMILIQT